MRAESGTWTRIKSLVLDSVTSPHSKRAYEQALDAFALWWADRQGTQGLPKPPYRHTEPRSKPRVWLLFNRGRQLGDAEPIQVFPHVSGDWDHGPPGRLRRVASTRVRIAAGARLPISSRDVPGLPASGPSARRG